jgi:hypothetical protein
MAAETEDYAKALPLRAPAAYLCDDDDYLRISVLSFGTQRVRVTGRVLDFNSCIKVLNHELAAPASRVTPATAIVKIGKGWLLNVTCVSLSAVTGLAQTIVTVDMVRGQNGGGGVTATLLQGPVSSLQRIAWPGSLLTSSLDVAGILRSITGTDPAAGVEISETVPSGARWRLRALAATLVTSATVANRTVSLRVDDGTTAYYGTDAPGTQPASNTVRYSAAEGVAAKTGTISEWNMAFPHTMVLGGGHRFRTVTNNLDAGDNWGAPQYLVEETLEGL